MTVGQKNIVPGVQLTAAVATYYTNPALTRARVCNATLTNTTAAPVACSVYMGNAATVAQAKISARTISPGETYSCPELINRVLEPGETIQAVGLGVSFDVSAITQS